MIACEVLLFFSVMQLDMIQNTTVEQHVNFSCVSGHANWRQLTGDLCEFMQSPTPRVSDRMHGHSIVCTVASTDVYFLHVHLNS